MTTLDDTTNNSFRYPTAANAGTDFATGVADLASDLDAMWSSGTVSAIPSAGKIGRRYFATDLEQEFVDNGTAWQNIGPRLVTSLPGSPYDGQQIAFLADSTNGVVWSFRYRSASSSTHKWEFIGGAPMRVDSVNLTDISLTMPFAGDYDIGYGAASVLGNPNVNLTLGIGGDPGITEFIGGSVSGGIVQSSGSVFRRVTGVAASQRFTMSSNGTGQITDIFIFATPVRVG